MKKFVIRTPLEIILRRQLSIASLIIEGASFLLISSIALPAVLAETWLEIHHPGLIGLMTSLGGLSYYFSVYRARNS